MRIDRVHSTFRTLRDYYFPTWPTRYEMAPADSIVVVALVFCLNYVRLCWKHRSDRRRREINRRRHQARIRRRVGSEHWPLLISWSAISSPPCSNLIQPSSVNSVRRFHRQRSILSYGFGDMCRPLCHMTSAISHVHVFLLAKDWRDRSGLKLPLTTDVMS